MKKCVYCDKTDNKITKEHVVNKSFLNKFYNKGNNYLKVYDKYTENYLTAKDVCSKCNNENLSKLDDYFLGFYEQNLPREQINSSTKIHLTYEYEMLSKWLLKTLYNSERRNSYEHLPNKMYRYKDYIIGKNNKIKLFKIFVELLQDVPREEIKKHFKNNEEDIPEKLNFLRIGNSVFAEQLNTGVTDLIKYISSSNLVFHIFILDPGKHNDIFFNPLLEKFTKANNLKNLTYLDPKKTDIVLKSSNRTILDILEKTIQGDKYFVDKMKE